MNDTAHISGILRIFEFPCDAAWLEIAERWKGFDLRERARQTEQIGGACALEVENLITSAGRTQLLSFAGASGSTTAFAQQFAVGTGTIYSVLPADSSLASELFRAQPASFSIVGNTATISTPFSTSQANGAYTNAGIFGNGATSTANSGTLMTHLLCTYVKISSLAITSDYTITFT